MKQRVDAIEEATSGSLKFRKLWRWCNTYNYRENVYNLLTTKSIWRQQVEFDKIPCVYPEIKTAIQGHLPRK